MNLLPRPTIILFLALCYVNVAYANIFGYLPPNPDESGPNGTIVGFPTTTTRRPIVTYTPRGTTPSTTTTTTTTRRPTVTTRRTTTTTTRRTTTPRRTTEHPHHDDHHHHHDDHHHHHHSSDPLDWLRDSVPGEPDRDYPIYWKVPETHFTCNGHRTGMYADPETRCQVFHICTELYAGQFMHVPIICPNGTIFNQKHFTCEWWQNVECGETESYYRLNELIGVVPDGAGSRDHGQVTFVEEPIIDVRLTHHVEAEVPRFQHIQPSAPARRQSFISRAF